jgi:predicted nucleic-acid-binding protein
LVLNKSITQAQQIEKEDILKIAEQLLPNKEYCADIAIVALLKAINYYIKRNKKL